MSEAQVKLSAVELAAVQRDFPALPQDYLDYLTRHGWGMTPSGRMLYSGPIGPEEIFGDAHEIPGVVLLGDDLAGYFFAFSFEARQYGEVDQRGNWESALIAKDICGYANDTPPGSV